MSRGPWNGNGRATTYVKSWVPGTIQREAIPHAILDSSHVVIAIRTYPRTTKSNSVIPIEEGMECAVGWVWKHSKFIRPTQE